jgi:hypothetical protein
MWLGVSLPNFMHRLVVCTGFGFRQVIASAIDPHFYSDDDATAKDWLSRIAQLMVPSKPEWRCPQLHTRERKHRSRMRTKVRFMSVSSRRKHIHHWYKSLAGGFRCACEAWRCEFAEGIRQCEIASEQGRKYCLPHLASRPTSVGAVRASKPRRRLQSTN